MSHAHQTGIYRHSLLLLIATQAGNAATMLFQVLMMRSLSVAEYGVLASMLGLILITSTPLEALRTAVAHQSALLSRTGKQGTIPALLRQWAGRLGVVAGIILAAGLLTSEPMARIFHLPDAAPVRLTAWIIASSLFMPLFMGGLQGMQSFRWFALHGQVWSVTRLLLAAGFIVWLGRTASAGLWAQWGGVWASITVGILAMMRALKHSQKEKAEPFAGGRYFFLSLLALTGFAVIMNADVVLVKRFFAPEEAGVFARAATIARSVVFLPLPVAAAMFPKVVSQGLTSLTDRDILYKAIGVTAGLTVTAAIFFTLAIRPVWWVFTGETPDPNAVSLARWLIWAMAPLGLTFLLANFEIAQRRFQAPLTLLLWALLYIIAVSKWHQTFAQVAIIMTVVSLGGLITHLIKFSYFTASRSTTISQAPPTQ